jgi:hypothetical protein
MSHRTTENGQNGEDENKWDTVLYGWSYTDGPYRQHATIRTLAGQGICLRYSVTRQGDKKKYVITRVAEWGSQRKSFDLIHFESFANRVLVVPLPSG